jgi:hypothetical protein
VEDEVEAAAIAPRDAAAATPNLPASANPPPWAHKDAEKELASFSTKFPVETDLKMVWVCATFPKMSKQKIVKAAVLEYVNRLIAAHYPHHGT